MYKVVGADQKEYGPVTSDQVRQWIGQGRANAQTLASFEGSPLRPLATFPEFADALRSAAPPPLSPTTGYGQATPGARTNTAAVAGLVFSILGVCCCFPLFSILGIVLASIGLYQIKSNPAVYTTQPGIAIIAIVIGFIWVSLIVIAFFAGMFDQVLKNLPR
jgi:hypothetical protein